MAGSGQGVVVVQGAGLEPGTAVQVGGGQGAPAPQQPAPQAPAPEPVDEQGDDADSTQGG